MALEFFATTAGNAAAMVRTTMGGEFSEMSLALCLRLALEVDEDGWEWDDPEKEEDWRADNENFVVGMEGIGRIAPSIGDRMYMPAVYKLATEFLGRGGADWRFRHAALHCLAQVSARVEMGTESGAALRAWRCSVPGPAPCLSSLPTSTRTPTRTSTRLT